MSCGFRFFKLRVNVEIHLFISSVQRSSHSSVHSHLTIKITFIYLDISVPLGVVHGSQGGLALPVLRVGHEDGSSALPLGTDDTTHLCNASTRVKHSKT